MLRQLARLTFPLPVAGPNALAVAVYANAADRTITAKESGFEGVACVDDTSRLLEVLCDVWERTHLPQVERWARGTLDFVLWMQEPDGRWLNFVRDWNGEKNRDGITSRIGENFWQARAVAAVACAALTFDDPRVAEALARGLAHAVAKPSPPDVRAIHVRAGVRLLGAGRPEMDRATVRTWCEEIVTCREGDVLKNSAYEDGTPHLWAHIQEGVLADAAVALEEPAWLEIAAASARAVVVPAIEAGFPAPGTSPYDVASCVFVCDRLAAATGERGWTSLAADARAWFDGRNPAGLPVYDRERGRVADGVDEGRVSGNSGAEANIVAAEVLPEDAGSSAGAIALSTDN